MIFIVGSSRSGTTLMARILSRHPDIHILNETHFMEEFCFEKNNFNTLTQKDIYHLINKMLTIEHKGYYSKNEIEKYQESETILNKLKKSFNQSFSSLISIFFIHEANKKGKSIPGDQTPRHIFYVNEIKEMFPEAKFINMVRDPRAVLLSQKFKWKAGLRKSVPLFETVRTYLNYHPVIMSYVWKQGIKSSLSVKDSIKKTSWIDVKFENLIDQPKANLSRVCDFLGIDFTDEMLNVPVSMSSTGTDEGKKGFSKNVSAKWISSLSSSEVYFSEKINQDLITHFGYHLLKQKPNVVQLIFIFAILPFQFLIIFILNYSRMGNHMYFIKKRLK
jgi:hypothetical protein